MVNCDAMTLGVIRPREARGAQRAVGVMRRQMEREPNLFEYLAEIPREKDGAPCMDDTTDDRGQIQV